MFHSLATSLSNATFHCGSSRDFLLAQATQYCFETKFRRRFYVYPLTSNVFNMLQTVQVDEYPATLSKRFVAEPAPGCKCNVLVSQSLQHQKQVLCCLWELTCCTYSHSLTNSLNSGQKVISTPRILCPSKLL